MTTVFLFPIYVQIPQFNIHKITEIRIMNSEVIIQG